VIVSARDDRIDDERSKSTVPSFDLADARESTLDCRECPDEAPLRDETVEPVSDIVNFASPDRTGNLAFNGRLRDCEYELFMILGMLSCCCGILKRSILSFVYRESGQFRDRQV
jgi:hypothetical protein